jgi:YVTN family beta-propeller protein
VKHFIVALAALALSAQDLPNGWKLTLLGKSIPTEDLILKSVVSPDGKAVIAVTAGFNPHGLVVVDTRTEQATQRITLKSAYNGLSWSPDGKSLYVSGGNANGKVPTRAPIYRFAYENGKLSAEPSGLLEESIDLADVFWTGVAHHPKKNLLYATNRGMGTDPGSVVVFDTATKQLKTRIPVELSPWDTVVSEDGKTLYVSNHASDSISVIDTATEKVVASIATDRNPNDMVLTQDGRLFVACSNSDRVDVIDTKTRAVMERISTAMYPRAPQGSTPNALAYDRANHILYVANADNNDIAVIDVAQKDRAEVAGFMPSGWYPSALTFLPASQKLYIGNSKGSGSYADLRGPHSPVADGSSEGKGSIKSLQKGSIQIVSMASVKTEVKNWTRQVLANTPYHDELLAEAKAPAVETIVPKEVGVGSPIKHVLYIIKENRTYDQVFGDVQKGNGDARLAIFGKQVTPNHHALADNFVLLDNLYCDGEVSEDGHQWTNAAYATDADEKQWPSGYGGHSKASYTRAYTPSSGYLWDQANKKGLTFRSYGEFAARASNNTPMEAAPWASGLSGHVATTFLKNGGHDTVRAAAFNAEVDNYDRNYNSTNPKLRLPNFMVMSLGEDHTQGTTPGAPTPRAAVANNDQAIGMIVERLSHSPYWKETAIFIIEDDAQDGADHVDAHRTVGMVISPFVRRETVDSSMYSTSSMVRTIELLLGLPPMTQYDAAANPMYKTFSAKADLTPYTLRKPEIDLEEKNTLLSYGARRSMKMDFSDDDRAPVQELNAIIWRSVKGADAPVPAPVHSFARPGVN